MKRPATMNITPRGGWRFTDPVTGIPHKDNHPMALLQAVRSSRLANGFEVKGGFEHEVWEDVCKQNPELNCVEEGVPEVVMTADDVMRFMTTLKEFAGRELVSEDEHKRRAEICMQCPMMGHTNCKSCGWVARTLTELLGGRKIHRPAEFHKRACKACGCNLDSKTYYPLDVLKTVDEKLGRTPDYWEKCWMRE